MFAIHENYFVSILKYQKFLSPNKSCQHFMLSTALEGKFGHQQKVEEYLRSPIISEGYLSALKPSLLFLTNLDDAKQLNCCELLADL